MGFAFRGRWLVLCRLRRCSGENPVSHRSCAVGEKVGLRPVREYEGEIFTDYYFGEANTANKSDKHHNNAINENLNWGGISGLLQLATTNSGSRPEIQDGPGGGRGEGEARDDEELHTTNKELDSMSNDELLSRQFSAERWHRRKNE